MTRRGRMMAVMLDDGTAQSEISVFNEQFEKHRDKLKEDRLLVVQGKVQRDDFSGGLRVTADDLLDLAALRARFGGRLRIEMNGATDKARDAKRLMDMLAPYRAPGRRLRGAGALRERGRQLRRRAGRRLARAAGRADAGRTERVAVARGGRVPVRQRGAQRLRSLLRDQRTSQDSARNFALTCRYHAFCSRSAGSARRFSARKPLSIG